MQTCRHDVGKDDSDASETKSFDLFKTGSSALCYQSESGHPFKKMRSFSHSKNFGVFVIMFQSNMEVNLKLTDNLVFAMSWLTIRN